MQEGLNKSCLKNTMNRILGTDYKVIDTDNGCKVKVPSLDITQMGELNDFYEMNYFVSDIKAKRSGTGITIIVETNE